MARAVAPLRGCDAGHPGLAAWCAAPLRGVLPLRLSPSGTVGLTPGGRAAVRSVTHAFRPNVTIPMRMGGQNLSESTIHNVILFLCLMAALQIFSMLFISALEPNLSFLGVFSSVQATLFNIGPGFEAVGPTQNFHFLRPTTKIFFSLLMILGRLELYAVMVLFVPSVWRRFS